MAGRKNQQTRKMPLGRGSKHRWQNHTAKIPAHIMTRLRARCHNQKTTANEANLTIRFAAMQNLLTGKTTPFRNETDRPKTLTKKPHRIKNECRENPLASEGDEHRLHKQPHFANRPTSRKNMRANGLRYPLVGGTRQRHFAGTSSKPNKLLENAQTPTCRVHALLGCFH